MFAIAEDYFDHTQMWSNDIRDDSLAQCNYLRHTQIVYWWYTAIDWTSSNSMDLVFLIST